MTKKAVAAKPVLSMGAWMQEWEESERGWGVRPDGVWYYATLDAANADTKRMVNKMRRMEAKTHHGMTPDEYSRPAGEPRFVQVSEKLSAEILDRGRAYRERRERL